MKSRFFPKFFYSLLVVFLSFATFQNAVAQNNFNENSKITFYLSGGDARIALLTRPRIYKSAEQIAAENTNTTVSKNTVNVNSLEHRVLDLVNQIRLEAGLPSLSWSEDVAKIARLHSSNMANLQFFSHTGRDGKMVNDRADLLGITKWRQLGENIAYNRGFKSPIESAVQSWMNSAGHRENILKADWKESGIGIAVTDTGKYYFTQVFLRKK